MWRLLSRATSTAVVNVETTVSGHIYSCHECGDHYLGPHVQLSSMWRLLSRATSTAVIKVESRRTCMQGSKINPFCRQIDNEGSDMGRDDLPIRERNSVSAYQTETASPPPWVYRSQCPKPEPGSSYIANLGLSKEKPIQTRENNSGISNKLLM